MGLEPRFSSHGALSSVLNGKNLDKMSERDRRGKETDSNVHCCTATYPISFSPSRKSLMSLPVIHQDLSPITLEGISVDLIDKQS